MRRQCGPPVQRHRSARAKRPQPNRNLRGRKCASIRSRAKRTSHHLLRIPRVTRQSPIRAILQRTTLATPPVHRSPQGQPSRSRPNDVLIEMNTAASLTGDLSQTIHLTTSTLVQRRIHIRTRRPGILTTQTMSSWILRTSALHCNHFEPQRRKKPSRQTHMTKIGSSLYLSRSRSSIAAARNISASHGHYAQAKVKVSR